MEKYDRHGLYIDLAFEFYYYYLLVLSFMVNIDTYQYAHLGSEYLGLGIP